MRRQGVKKAVAIVTLCVFALCRSLCGMAYGAAGGNSDRVVTHPTPPSAAAIWEVSNKRDDSARGVVVGNQSQDLNNATSNIIQGEQMRQTAESKGDTGGAAIAFIVIIGGILALAAAAGGGGASSGA